MNLKQKIKDRLRPAKIWLKEKAVSAKHRLMKTINPPKIMKNEDGSVLIHLGCGYENDPRYINVDAIPLPHVNFVSRVEKLPMFPNDYADLIYACHVLEHISHRHLIDTLKEWRRVLKPGGVLRISLPDFEKIIDIYEENERQIESMMMPLMGGQDYAYNFHKSVFNQKYLKKILEDAGFKQTRGWDPENAKYYSFKDWAQKKVRNKYPISLNMEAVK